MLKHINCTSQQQFRKILPRDDLAVISITEPGEDVSFTYIHKNSLILQFSDVQRKVNAYTIPIEKYQVKEIIDFVKEIYDSEKEYSLLVHCAAGVSRSAAIVYWVHKYYEIELPEKFEYLKSPNILVLRMLLEESYNKKFEIIKKYDSNSLEFSWDGSLSKETIEIVEV